MKLVNRKIVESMSEFSLEPETVDNMRSKCFQVNEDTYEELPAETKALKRSLPCQSLMWDSTEVSGPPHKPLSNAQQNWDERLRRPGKIKADWTETPPVCGRIAVALMQRPLTHAPL